MNKYTSKTYYYIINNWALFADSCIIDIIDTMKINVEVKLSISFLYKIKNSSPN